MHFGISPSEFWKMSPSEGAFYIKTKAKQYIKDDVSNEKNEQMQRLRDKLESQGVNVV